MTQEEKELLLKAICGYLPYALQVRNPRLGGPDYATGIDTETWELQVLYNGYTDDIEKFKPYLRSMDDMTEEEKKEMHNLLSPEGTAVYENNGISMPMNHCGEFVPYEFMNRVIQYLLEHHFDFMGLIPKGLALEAQEGTYNIRGGDKL